MDDKPNINTSCLWIDKYRPLQLSKLDYHVAQAEMLKKMAASSDVPHLLFFGPPGAGKSTRVMCFLRQLYGSGVLRRKIQHFTFDTPSGKRLEIASVASNYHVQINPSDAKIYDRVVVQEVIKNMAQIEQLDKVAQKDFKVLVLNGVEKLTKDAQQALRRTMEKYSATCRLILVCRHAPTGLIPALRSRCLPVRVSAPSDPEVISILQNVCRKEGLQIPNELATRIAAASDGNLRRALLMCETCRVFTINLSPNQQIVEPDWEIYLKKTAEMIAQEQSPQRLKDVRERLYVLLGHDIPPDIIFKNLTLELCRSCDRCMKSQVCRIAAQAQHRSINGSKVIFHLEAFVAKFMSLYKHYLEDSMMGMFD